MAVEPLNVYIDPAQIVALGPAEAVAAFEIVRDMELVAFPQGEFPVAVSVSVTIPALISAPLGVYTGCSIVILSNVPVPVVVQARLA